MKTTFFISIIIMIKHRKLVIKNEKVGFVLQEYGKVFCKDNFTKHYSPISKVCFGCCCGDEMLKKNSMKTSTES